MQPQSVDCAWRVERVAQAIAYGTSVACLPACQEADGGGVAGHGQGQLKNAV